MVKFKPCKDKILVKPLEMDSQSGLIHIPEKARERKAQGIVMAVGPGKKKPIDLSPGDRICFGFYTGFDFKIDGVEYLIMKEDDVFCVIPHDSI